MPEFYLRFTPDNLDRSTLTLGPYENLELRDNEIVADLEDLAYYSFEQTAWLIAGHEGAFLGATLKTEVGQ